MPVHNDPAPWRTRLLSGYGDAVLAAATADPTLSRAYLDVMQMLAPPASLARPDLALRVLAHRLGRERRRRRRHPVPGREARALDRAPA